MEHSRKNMNNLEKGSISNLLMNNTAPSCYDVFVANDEVEIGEVEIGEGKNCLSKSSFPCADTTFIG